MLEPSYKLHLSLSFLLRINFFTQSPQIWELMLLSSLLETSTKLQNQILIFGE